MSLNDHKLTNLVSAELFETARETIRQLAEINDVVLDYSNESIQNIEKILTLMHEDYRKTKNMEGLNGIILACAAYIVETIKKNTGVGSWYCDDSEFGKDTFPFEWKEGKVIYPVSWCEKRIFDGKGDDVWFKYKAIILTGQ